LKVAVVCDSVLLKKSLELFLRGKLSDFASADVVISDRNFECEKPILLVGNSNNCDIKKPFGKVKLISLLENYENDVKVKKEILEPKTKSVQSSDKSMEDQLDSLLKEFTRKLVEIIKTNK
jgi:hypothetical protein